MENKKNDIETLISSIDGLKIEYPGEVISQINSGLRRVTVKCLYNEEKAVFRCYKKYAGWNDVHCYNEAKSLIDLKSFFGTFNPEVLYNDQDNLCVIETYLDGFPAGQQATFESEFIDAVKPLEIIDFLKKIKTAKVNLREWPVTIEDFYPDRFNFYRENLSCQSLPLIEKMEKFYEKSVRPHLKEEKYFSHGDLNAGNFIYNDDGFVGLIDWESTRLDSYWRDFANVYYRALPYPKWREEYLKLLSLNGFDQKLFYFFYLFYLLDDSAHAEEMIRENKKESYRSGILSKLEIVKKIERNLIEFTELVGQL